MRSCAVRVLQAALAAPKGCTGSGVLSFANAGLVNGLPKLQSILAASDVSGEKLASCPTRRQFAPILSTRHISDNSDVEQQMGRPVPPPPSPEEAAYIGGGDRNQLQYFCCAGACQAAASSSWHGRHYGGFGHGHVLGSEQLVPGEAVTMHDPQRKSAMSGVVAYTSTESLAVDLLLARSELEHPLTAVLRQSGMLLEAAQASLEAGPEEMKMDSVKRKRASKMNKHKHRKRRKRERMRK